MTDARGISVETVERADALAATVLSLVDVLATGQRSVNDILADAINQADDYRASRLAAAHQGERPASQTDPMAAFSRYGDHDRACPSREDSLYACTCGFVQTVNELAHQGEGT